MQLLSSPEDNFVERKPESVKSAELRQTLCAFANSIPEGREAVVYIGIEDQTGAVLGVENTESLQKRIRTVCRDDCYPAIQYTSEVLPFEQGRVVAVVIPFSKTRPHFAGPAFVRVGSQSVKASDSQYEELILSRTDKARQLILYKANHIFVLVRGINYRLGSNEPFSGGGHCEERECKVDRCNGFNVRLDWVAQGQCFTEDLTRVNISVDDKKDRPMLLVTAPGR